MLALPLASAGNHVVLVSVVLEAFPDTPWAFIFREPVQVLMSHLDPSKGNAVPVCLRSRATSASAPAGVKAALELMNTHPKSATREEYCGAHLTMLCEVAYDAFLTYGKDNEGRPRAVLVDYEALPGIVPRVLLPVAGRTVDAAWLESMKTEAAFYSKDRQVWRMSL
jgi:hypothetical protein